VVNAGMLLEVWSNKRYKAALHRVLANNKHPRYSFAFFSHPTYETTINPILLPSDPTPKYKSIHYGDFRKLYYEGFAKQIPLNQQARLPNYRI